MGPIATDAAKNAEGKSIQFVKFDFTSDETKAASAAKAEKFGVADLYKEHAPKTGFALLYDTKSKKVIKKLTASEDVAAWTAEINKALGKG